MHKDSEEEMNEFVKNYNLNLLGKKNMKALQCVELGMPDKLEVNEVPDPEVLPDHVLIENKAASVNFPDVLMIQGLYQFQPELPFTPGGESAGIVSAVGDGVENIEVGDRVFAMTGLGAFSEKIVAPKHAVVKIPDSMDFETAAALPEAYGTSLYALKQRAELKEGGSLSAWSRWRSRLSYCGAW